MKQIFLIIKFFLIEKKLNFENPVTHEGTKKSEFIIAKRK